MTILLVIIQWGYNKSFVYGSSPILIATTVFCRYGVAWCYSVASHNVSGIFNDQVMQAITKILSRYKVDLNDVSFGYALFKEHQGSLCVFRQSEVCMWMKA